MGREAIKIPTIRSVYGDQIICDGGAFGIGRQGGVYDPYYPGGSDADCVLYHAYWDQTADDHSPIGTNDGNVIGATFIPLGLSFDGTDDGVQVTHDASIQPADAITIHAWVYADSWSGYDGIVTKTNAWSDGYQIFVRDGAAQIQYTINNTNAFINVPSATVWHLLTLVYDKVNITPYVDASVGTPVAYSTAISNNGSVKLGIGYHTYLDGNPSGNYPFHGDIGEVLIFNTAHDSTDVTTYYNSTKARYGVA